MCVGYVPFRRQILGPGARAMSACGCTGHLARVAPVSLSVCSCTTRAHAMLQSRLTPCIALAVKGRALGLLCRHTTSISASQNLVLTGQLVCSRRTNFRMSGGRGLCELSAQAGPTHMQGRVVRAGGAGCGRPNTLNGVG